MKTPAKTNTPSATEVMSPATARATPNEKENKRDQRVSLSMQYNKQSELKLKQEDDRLRFEQMHKMLQSQLEERKFAFEKDQLEYERAREAKRHEVQLELEARRITNEEKQVKTKLLVTLLEKGMSKEDIKEMLQMME